MQPLKVSVDVSNTGKVFGKEVVQLYVEDIKSTVIRPLRELKEFAKVSLNPGETKTVTFELNKRAFSYFNTEINDWHVESGDFNIAIGKSSRNIVCSEKIFVESTVNIPTIYDDNSTIGDILSNPIAALKLKPLMDKYMASSILDNGNNSTSSLEAISPEMIEAMFKYMPLRQLIGFGGGMFTYEDLYKVIELLNQ